MADQTDVAKTLAAMAQLRGITFTEDASDMLMKDLETFDPNAVLIALRKCRHELPRFPTTADIIARIQAQDGRPGFEEAWAMLAKDEYTAVYTNNEIQEAGGASDKLLRETGDHVAARMAFKEIYERVVREAREAGKKPSWWLSRAQGPSRESADEAAIKDAVSKKRLSAPEAYALLPDHHVAQMRDDSVKAIADAASVEMVDPEEARRMIQETISKMSGMPKA